MDQTCAKWGHNHQTRLSDHCVVSSSWYISWCVLYFIVVQARVFPDLGVSPTKKEKLDMEKFHRLKETNERHLPGWMDGKT